jgi:allophanate hydrolase subunit 1
MRALPYGDRGTLIDLGDQRLVAPALARLAEHFGGEQLQAGWCTILVPPDIAAADAAAVLAGLQPADHVGSDDPVVVDVVYDGIDLADVATQLAISEDDVVSMHSGASYTVVFLGFCRGFPYLDGLPDALRAVPRLATPRARIDAGSVAIGGGQAGVYPVASPGGWRVLGHTTAPLFDPARWPPTELQPGSSVRFRAVSTR